VLDGLGLRCIRRGRGLLELVRHTVRGESWSGTNQCGWSNPENDRLVAEAAATLDPAKKKDLFAKHLALWTRELPHIPLLSPPANHFAKKSIKNFSSGYDNGLGWAIYNWYLQE
jgi:ABC-type dipeptide transport system, periplasmic component